MPKQVNVDKDAGDLGIGQKHDPPAKRFKGEKGKEKLQGAGCEMVVGDGVATRSVSKAKKACEDPLSRSESDESLYMMFKEWAIKHEKYYETAEEEKKRFNIWCATKEEFDGLNSRQKQAGGVRYGLTVFADLTLEEFMERYTMRFPTPLETQTIQAVSEKEVTEHNKMEEKRKAEQEAYDKWVAAEHNKMEEKREAKEKKAFDKWVAEQKRNYSNEFEREVGFTMYRTNTRWINSLLNEDPDPGKYSTSPTDLDILLDQVMTLTEVQNLLYGFTQNIIGSAVEGGLSSYNRQLY